ncbi:hypothetical protein [Janthinobacterium sp. PC23-8]|uniref:hypothetical protein n=1 Tax=Janthinobacterium sp. PC23-8 TaxID=2012679 RepID=UPI00114067E7|nr:hypothetical protein [Janthinobacterium sp. PC23-8]
MREKNTAARDSCRAVCGVCATLSAHRLRPATSAQAAFFRMACRDCIAIKSFLIIKRKNLFF